MLGYYYIYCRESATRAAVCAVWKISQCLSHEGNYGALTFVLYCFVSLRALRLTHE